MNTILYNDLTEQQNTIYTVTISNGKHKQRWQIIYAFKRNDKKRKVWNEKLKQTSKMQSRTA